MKLNPARWLARIWPFQRDRAALIGEYLAIGAQHRLFLTDVALRGGVYRSAHAPGDHDQTLINIGRQELALEIIELCNEKPDGLWALVPRPADEKGTT